MAKQYTVLIVDDSADQRRGYRSIFEAEGFNVIEAIDGHFGYNEALEKKPDLILTGIIMPRIDGFSMLEELHKNPATAKIPAMIISHRGRPEDKARADKMGIKDFLISGFVTPKEVIWRAYLRLEGRRHKQYIIAADESAYDAASLIADFTLPSKLHCASHLGEKLTLLLQENPEEPGTFIAKFVCPTEATDTFKKADA